jgi:hypothetical protein
MKPAIDNGGGFESYAGQVARAREAGLSAATIESVRQGCYSDAQLERMINPLVRPRTSLADVTQVEIIVGDTMTDLQWKVLTLAQLQLRHLMDLVEPGRTITVEIAVLP